MTIATLLGLGKIKPYVSKQAVPVDNADPSRLYGLELEIEGVREWDTMVVPGMYTEEDGSLRNNGREFITQPMSFSILSHVLTSFFNKTKFTAANYSERTSVHVHANCADLEPDQLATVCLLYQVFEKLLFNFVGGDRDKNIFCVPWSETNITFNCLKDFADTGNLGHLKSWHKYTALNLLPLFAQGTIEFRHMPGNPDKDHILTWVNLIGSLFSYAQKHTFKETKLRLQNLNTSSEYALILDLVFTKWAGALKQGLYISQLEEGVLAFKYAFISNIYTNNKKEHAARVPHRLALPIQELGEALTVLQRGWADVNHIMQVNTLPEGWINLPNQQVVQPAF